MKRLGHIFFILALLISASAVTVPTLFAETLTIVSGTPQSTMVRSAFAQPLRVRLTDFEGEPISTKPILFTSPGTGASLNGILVAAVTNSDGIASLIATANNIVGSYQVVASYSGAISVTFDLTNASSEPKTITPIAGTPQSTEVGTQFAARLEVTVRDEFGNPVPAVIVTFTYVRTVNARPIFPDGNAAMTDLEGRASLRVQASSSWGSYTITARSGSASPATFELTNTAKAVTLYVPALSSGTANQLGIAWTNPLDKPVSLTLTARSYAGQIIAGAGIQNPAVVTVSAHGQVARQATEIFGQGIAQQGGWIQLTPSDPGGSGFFLLYNDQLSNCDGGLLLDRPAPRLFFPQVNKDTILHVVNTSNNAILPASVAMYDNNGGQVGSATVSLEARTGWTGRITDLLPAAANSEGYVLVDTQGGPFAGRVAALVGMSSYQLGGDSAVVLAQSDFSSITNTYAVHVASGGGYASRLKLVNLGSVQQQVLLTLNGTTIQRSIPASGRLDESLDQIFGLSPSIGATGYLRVLTLTDNPGLAGFVEISASNGRLLTAEYFTGESEIQHVFSHVAQGLGYWTGLALYNPDTVTVAATIEVISSSGALVASRVVAIPPDQRVVGLLSDLAPGISNQFGGLVRITSTRPIYTFEVVTGVEGANFMANIPVSIY